MSAADALTPHVFLVRHGETEWAKAGRQTGMVDMELTSEGIKQVISTAKVLVGPGRLLDPARLARIFVSPLRRARQTFELLMVEDGHYTAESEAVTFTKDILEWDYGDYEGLTIKEIRAQRKEKGFDKEREWDIWRDGCESGESPEQVTQRLDRLIAQIRDIHRPCMKGEKPADVVLVAHGLVLRAFAKRWLNYTLDSPLPLMLAPSGIGIVSYRINNIDKPGLHLGLALPTAR